MGGTCCCCFGLRTGSFLISLMFTAMSIALIVGVTMFWNDDFSLIYEGISGENQELVQKVMITVLAISACISGSLLFAIIIKNRALMVLWLVWYGIILPLALIFFLVVFGLGVWAIFDDLEQYIGWKPEESIGLLEWPIFDASQQKWIRDKAAYSMLIACSIAMTVISILLYWYAKIKYYRRHLKYAIERQYP